MGNSTRFDPEILWQILEISKQLSSPIELDDMLTMVVDLAREVLEAERGTVFLFDKDSCELYARVGTGLATQEIRFSSHLGIAGLCAVSGDIINVPDAYSHERFNPEIDRQVGFQTRCLLAVPLVGLDGELVGVLQLINKTGGEFDEEDERVAAVLASQCAVALQRARLLQEFMIKQKLERDLVLARAIQREMLPKVMPQVDGYELAGWNEPADHTGGDIFDAIRLENGNLMLLLADATGHGLGPALSITQFRAMVRMAFRLSSGLDDIHDHVNRQLTDDLAGDRFITAFVGILNCEDHRVSYHACGQGPILHYHKTSGEVDQLPASTIPFGIMPDIPLSPPDPIALNSGDILALVSDGIFEQENFDSSQFGIDSVISVLRTLSEAPLDEIVKSIQDTVVSYAGSRSQDDDMTILLLRRTV